MHGPIGLLECGSHHKGTNSLLSSFDSAFRPRKMASGIIIFFKKLLSANAKRVDDSVFLLGKKTKVLYLFLILFMNLSYLWHPSFVL